MSDRGRDRRGGYVKWFFIILACFVCASPFIGLLMDVFIVFRPSSDSRGHGTFFLTIMFPMFAIIAAVVAAIVFAVTVLIVKASARRRKVLGRNHHDDLHYEYLKILQKCDDPHVPAMILHEVDPSAGRCSMRCIYIYQNGYVENFVNGGVYVPVPTVESIHASGALYGQSVYIITEGEFEDIWNIGYYVKA